MYLNETYVKKWAPVLDHGDLPKVTDPYKRAVTALVLENQERALMEESRSMQNLWEAGSVAGGGLPNNIGGGSSPVNGRRRNQGLRPNSNRIGPSCTTKPNGL